MTSGALFGSTDTPAARLLAEPGTAIVNPASAGWATFRRWPRLCDTLRARGLRFDAMLTTESGQAGQLARKAADAGARWLLCVGGDGTFNEVINGLAAADGRVSPDLAIGFIPSGTGLDLARNLDLPLDPIAAADVIGAATRRIDLGRVCFEDGHSRLFANMGGAGFDAEVVARANPLRSRLPGKIPYAVGIVSTLRDFRQRRVEIEVETGDDRQQLELDAYMVVACNGPSFGGGMRLTPDATLDDGLLDLFVLGEAQPWEILTRLPSVYRGEHLDHPGTHIIRATRAWVRSDEPTAIQTDGEPEGELPALFEVVPAAITVLT